MKVFENEEDWFGPKEEVCKKLLVKIESGEFFCLGDVPEEFKTYEICLAAVRSNGANLYYVPERFKSVEVCEAARRSGDWVFKFIPKELIYCLGIFDKKLLTEREILEKHSTEELLTSNNAYLRKLGLERSL